MKKLISTMVMASALALTAATAHAGEIAVIVKTTNSNFWTKREQRRQRRDRRPGSTFHDLQRAGFGICDCRSGEPC